jgi:hypothetical protein
MPAPERKRQTTWKTFIQSHWDVLGAIDFTTIEVWTKGGGDLLSAVRDEAGYTLGALCRMHGQSDGGVDDAGCPESGGNPCVTPDANPSYRVLSRPRFARRTTCKRKSSRDLGVVPVL